MSRAVCQAFPELPWLSDRDHVTTTDRLRMVGACRACGVFERCSAFADAEQVSGGFWAGDFRDLPDVLDVAEVPRPEQPHSDREPVAS